MQTQSLLSQDGIVIHYAHTEIANHKSWLTLILPFGLQVTAANAFFAYLASQYNIVTWQARSIVDPQEKQLAVGELTVQHHVEDLFQILAALAVEQCDLIGYCSGAGIALAAANQQPAKFNRLCLVNGEYALLKEPGCSTQYGLDIDSLLPLAANDIKTAQFILTRMNINTDPDKSLPEGFHLPFSQAYILNRYAINYVAYKSIDFAALASTIPHKTLVMTGDLDQQSNTNSSVKIQQLITNAQLHVDPMGDHYGIVKTQSETLQTIASFLVN